MSNGRSRTGWSTQGGGSSRGRGYASIDVITMLQPFGTFEKIVQLVVTARWIAFSFPQHFQCPRFLLFLLLLLLLFRQIASEFHRSSFFFTPHGILSGCFSDAWGQATSNSSRHVPSDIFSHHPLVSEIFFFLSSSFLFLHFKLIFFFNHFKLNVVKQRN